MLKGTASAVFMWGLYWLMTAVVGCSRGSMETSNESATITEVDTSSLFASVVSMDPGEKEGLGGSGFIAAPLAAGALPVHVVKPPVCHSGDLDLIREELKLKPEMALILSLEPLNPAAGSPQATSVKLTYQQLLADYHGRLNLPNVSAPTAMGLFICSDTSGDVSCSRKVRGDLQGAFAQVMA